MAVSATEAAPSPNDHLLEVCTELAFLNVTGVNRQAVATGVNPAEIFFSVI